MATDAFSIAAAGMSADMARLTAISHNLANATTPGFRCELVVTRPFAEVVDRLRGTVLLPVQHTAHDLRAGTLRATGAPLDLALLDDAWFEVQAADGPAYTRRGDFKVDAGGRLVTAAGLALAGDGGDIVLAGGTPRIGVDGTVFENERAVGRLRLVRFADTQSLVPLGDGLYRPAAGVPLPADGARVRQGHLENANVNTVAEMVKLVETMRRFESSQRLVQNLDDSLGRAIRTLGEF